MSTCRGSIICTLLLLLRYSSIGSETPVPCDENEGGDCLTPNCTLAANYLMKGIDKSIDPCDDFYLFACGKVIAEAEKRGNTVRLMENAMEETSKQLKALLAEALRSKEPKAIQSVKKIYKSCVNTPAIINDTQPLLKMLNYIGNWPVLDENWENKQQNFTTTLKIFSMFGMKLNNNYLQDYMVEVATLLGAKKHIAEKDMSDVTKFGLKLNNAVKNYNKQWYRFINFWIEYSENLPRITNKVITQSLSSTKRLYFEILLETPIKVQTNYIIWRIVEKIIKLYHTKRLKQAFEKHYKPQNRLDICYDIVTNGALKVLLDVMYIRKYFPIQMKQNVQSIKYDIIHKMRRILNKIEWSEGKSMDDALENLNDNIFLGTTHWFENATIDFEYEGLNIDNNTFLENYLSFIQFEINKSVDLQNIGSKNYSFLSTAFASRYKTSNIQVFISLSIILEALKFSNPPNYFSYARFGAILGHELYHAISFKYDHRMWYPSDFRECVKGQYSNYTVEESGMPLNGLTSLHENIADIAGFKTAYNAYIEWTKRNGDECTATNSRYTQKQLFWISLANMWCRAVPKSYISKNPIERIHSPGKYRVIGTLSNYRKFARDFNCPVGAKMNPAHKCIIKYKK